MKTLAAVIGFVSVGIICGCNGTTEGMNSCSDGEQSLRILAPDDGATFGAEDDLEPGGVLDLDVMVAHCGFELGAQVGIYLLEPLESAYGFAMVGEGDLVYRVPFIPGQQRIQARSQDGAIQSEVIAFTVEP